MPDESTASQRIISRDELMFRLLSRREAEINDLRYIRMRQDFEC